MLTGRALDAGAARREAVHLGIAEGQPAFLRILFHIAKRRLIRQCADRACFEHMILAEQRLGIAVGARLVLAGEV